MLLMPVLIIWGVVTAAFVVVMIWKSFIGYSEEDVLVLSAGETQQAIERRQVIAKVERLGSWAKVLGGASLILLLVAACIWGYGAFMTFNHPQVP